MNIDEKLDLILEKLDRQDERLDTIEDAIVNVNKRLTIMEGDLHTLNLKVDELRTWTRLDLKDNPFLRHKKSI